MNYAVCLLLAVLLAPDLHAQTGFSQDSALAVLRHLSVDIGPRPMGSPAEGRALEFAAERFRTAGCDTAFVMPLTNADGTNTTSGIAVGIKRGVSHRIILVGGHMDSAGPEIPGADDDGSGSATVIELARVLRRRPMHSTIVFCCFGGEEQGLEGSRYFVDHFNEIDSIDLMLQADMANGTGIISLDPHSHTTSAPRWLVDALIDEFNRLGYSHLTYPTHFFSLDYALPAGAGSDQEPFLDAGVPAIDLSTDVGKPIHTPRDNFENFEPAGLKRTGDVILGLVERYDAGVPQRETDKYWMILLGSMLIYLTIWEVRVFGLLAIAAAVTAFVVARRRRVPPPLQIRWSGLKMWLFAIVIAGAGWLSSDLVGLVLGVRFPWYAHPGAYYLLAGLGCLIGVCISLWFERSLRLSRCPYVFFKRAAIMLVIILIFCSILGTRLIMEPAVALLLLSLAVLVRPAPLKIVFVALSPWWMLRLVFSEWSDLFSRAIATGIPSSLPVWLSFNTVMVLFLSVYILPFLYGAAAAIRDSAPLNRWLTFLRSRWTFAASLVLFALYGWRLTLLPAYDRLWYKPVTTEERYDLSTHEREAVVRSPEYLEGLTVGYGGKDTLLTSHSNEFRLPGLGGFDTSLAWVDRDVRESAATGTTIYRIDLRLHQTVRPYTVTVTYSSKGKAPEAFDTPLHYRLGREGAVIRWYSFPDTLISLPVTFSVPDSGKVIETVDITFDTLAYPVVAKGPLTYVIPRTHFVDRREYGG